MGFIVTFLLFEMTITRIGSLDSAAYGFCMGVVGFEQTKPTGASCSPNGATGVSYADKNEVCYFISSHFSSGAVISLS